MTQQTAVEWLENQIKNSKYFYKLMEDINSRSTVAQSNIFEQAKAMEKEQIIDSFVECWKENMPDGYECKQSAEYYYNETFKQD
jgi:HEPN domain-containing protein